MVLVFAEELQPRTASMLTHRALFCAVGVVAPADLLKCLVKHQTLFVNCEREMQSVLHPLLHLRNVGMVVFAI